MNDEESRTPAEPHPAAEQVVRESGPPSAPPPADDSISMTVIEEDVSGHPPAGDWNEPETISAEQSSSSKKRKRRRKKSKKPGEESETAETDSEIDPAAESTAAVPQPPKPQPPRVQLDAEAVANLARKIYLAEVSEEGVALVDDRGAKELSRRCFRLAEIFLEEQARRN